MSFLTQCLAGTLDGDPNIRIQAELKLSELFTQNQFSFETDKPSMTVSTSLDSEARVLHSAAAAVGKYVNERWSPIFNAWKGTSAPPEASVQVRSTLFRGLSDPARGIRSVIASVISKIAHSDWPDHYSTLLNDLIGLLQSGSTDAIHGALQVFSDLSKDELTEEQLIPVLRELVPILITVVGQAEHTNFTRARAISTFKQSIVSLIMVKDQYPDAIAEASSGVLPQWLETFGALLEADPLAELRGSPDWSPLAVRLQIFRTLVAIAISLPKILAPVYPNFVAISISHLEALLPVFQRYYVAHDNETPPPTTPADDPDQMVALPVLASSIFEFLGLAARSRVLQSYFLDRDEAHLERCVRLVPLWAQMTEDDRQTWSSDSNAFIAEQDDDAPLMTLRTATIDFLQVNLLDAFSTSTVRKLQETTAGIVEQSSQARQEGNADWWKPLEAALAVLGAESDALSDIVQAEADEGRPKPFDTDTLLGSVIPSLLGIHDCPFLQGRAFVFAGNFATFLSPELTGQYLNAAVGVIELPHAGIPVKVSTVKAIQRLTRSAKSPLAKSYAPRILATLAPFLSTAADETLSLILDTLTIVVQIDLGSWLNPDVVSSLTAALVDVWKRNYEGKLQSRSELHAEPLNPILLSEIAEMVKALAASPSPDAFSSVVNRLLPAIVGALDQAALKPQESWIASSALELTAGILEAADKGKLGDGFVAGLAPSLFNSLSMATDRDVILNGCECVTLIVRKGSDQLISWRNPSGQSGIQVVLALVSKMVSPSENEAAGLLVGDLIVHLIRNCGEAIFPVLPELLQTLANRIPTAETTTFIQSLIVPFAFLIHSHRDTVLSLLESMTVSTGPSTSENGLNILIKTWCEYAESFIGFWPCRISIVALCDLFLAPNLRLKEIDVKGDIIIRPETRDVVMTRSRAKQIPTEYERTKFPVKALKLILHELQATETLTKEETKPDNVESDDGDDEWADDEIFEGIKDEELVFLSDVLDEVEKPESAEDDEDLKDDPVSQLDMRAYLLSFIQQCASADPNTFALIARQLTENEANVVQRIIIG
ncbi:ARM repeat-containing protein [Cantharellus anzutake]|uniref:ARM repeat-containing protein n=1 Tax=Cantharellus anzutake TaxID=1750568 RepID=UPI001906AA1C|nr:ARM repeat-containing protein [Cantharellus anzutake]KAF8336339.1 ARM repeat-containing protein [Cantharellus anzutake]